MGKMSEDEFLKLVEQVNNVLLHQDETPFLHGVSQAPFGVSKESIAPSQNLSSTTHEEICEKCGQIILNKN